ncbi:MAG: hypothetical protein RMJ51_06735 [Candidatus Calescibacterium sp.]|nr:hypothetical protein [Candidatus Calescibacterium sp.]MCX7759266.1 hypothetical protein [bacterium]MDW8195911.1 hypothetical protein [Candidatus Calescibacterium sp.]
MSVTTNRGILSVKGNVIQMKTNLSYLSIGISVSSMKSRVVLSYSSIRKTIVLSVLL